MKYYTSVAAVLVSVALAQGRTFTITNKCSYTVWPAIFTGGGTVTPDYANGWEADPGTSVSFTVADGWSAGRIWGRRECDFSSGDTSATACVTGGCSGGVVCTGIGNTPASLAEFTLGTGTGADWYDVSLVDGFNLPIQIDNSAGCSVASCPVDLDANCPAPLQGPIDSSGAVLGCKSACDAGLGNTASGSPNCCTGNYSTSATCPSSGVDYYSYFKDNCPDAYAYAYDEGSGTALWQCDSSLEADYTITFCP